MAVTIIQQGDIAKFEGDVIFNSVGTESDNFGGICKSIMTAAGSDFLLKSVKKVKDVYVVGDIFFSNGYNLPTKKIAHLVTTYYEDDKDYSLFTKLIDEAILECYRRKLYRIGIPLIGCGANKYDKNKVIEIIERRGNYFSKFYKELDIYIVTAEKTISVMNRRRLSDEEDLDGNYHSEVTLKKFHKESKIYKDYAKDNQPYLLNTKQKKSIKTIRDYIYIMLDNKEDEKILNDRLLRYLGFGKGSSKDVKSQGSSIFNKVAKTKVVTKDFLYKIIFALLLDEEEALELLNIFGYTFALPGINRKDDVVRNLIKNEQYGIIEINEALMEAKQKPLFALN